MELSGRIDAGSLAAVLDMVCATSFDSVMVTEVGDGTSETPIVYVNGAFTELTGYSADEVLGRSPSFLQGPGTDRSVIDQLVRDLEAGRRFQGRTVNYRKDGSPFIMKWRVVPVRSGEDLTHYLAVQRAD